MERRRRVAVLFRPFACRVAAEAVGELANRIARMETLEPMPRDIALPVEGAGHLNTPRCGRIRIVAKVHRGEHGSRKAVGLCEAPQRRLETLDNVSGPANLGLGLLEESTRRVTDCEPEEAAMKTILRLAAADALDMRRSYDVIRHTGVSSAGDPKSDRRKRFLRSDQVRVVPRDFLFRHQLVR
jgi:hypothetical protein